MNMRIAILASSDIRREPFSYSPGEKFVELLAEGLIARNCEVTLFVTGTSIARDDLQAVVNRGYEEKGPIKPEVAAYLHVANLMERAHDFDLIHNHFGFPALAFSGLIRTPMLTTIQERPSDDVLPIYKKYNQTTFYVALSQAARHPELDYLATIYPGLDPREFTFNDEPGDYLLFLDPIDADHGALEAMEIARKAGRKLILAGFIKNKEYFEKEINPRIDGKEIIFLNLSSQAERVRLLASAYALLHPANYDEPFCLYILEAQACGTPVITTKKGAGSEIIIEGQTGFIVDNLEAAVERVNEIKKLNRADCRRLIETKFSRERMVTEYLEVYQKVAEGSLGKGEKGLRPWGRYIVLEEKARHKVKRIEVREGMRLSYQRHRRRSEHWFILEGKALVTINGQENLLLPGMAIDIPAMALHRIEAREGTVVFIEVQRGDYLGEDDVERVEDDFGRL